MRYLLLYPELTYEIFDDAGVLLLASLRVLKLAAVDYFC